MKNKPNLPSLCVSISLAILSSNLRGENLIPNGDLEAGPIEEVVYTARSENMTSFQGSPVSGDSSNGANICAEVTLLGENSIVYFKPRMLVDPNRKYRISVRIFTEVDVDLRIGGDGKSEDGSLIPLERGGFWGFILKTEDGQLGKGPFSGWTTLSATFGPEGSEADIVLIPEVVSLSMVFRIKGGEGQKFYIDDLVFEEVEGQK